MQQRVQASNMAQNHFIRSNKSIINPNKLKDSTDNMFSGEVSKDGELKKIKGPFLQWYVQMHIPGVYRVVHNLGRTDYAVSASRMTHDPLSLETSNLTDTYFDVKITQNGEDVKAPFRFSLNILVK
jgi:hypothetical protein